VGVLTKRYPMSGVGTPRVMPWQDRPFNGDSLVAVRILDISDRLNLTRAVETGTCYGSTAMWLAEHFESVTSFEVEEAYFREAQLRCSLRGLQVNLIHGDSVSGLRDYLREHGSDATLFFLDAHWGEHCPLHDELRLIAESSGGAFSSAIVVHDVKVPDRPDLGYDTYPDGEPFTLASMEELLDEIYGRGRYKADYNSDAAGARRGVLYVEPA